MPDNLSSSQQHVSTTRILFVCHANICRSPMAEAIMRDLVTDAGMTNSVDIDSAGTFAHVGEPAYVGTQNILRQSGIRSFPSLSRQIEYEDLNTFHYVLAMDRRNLTFLLRHGVGCRADVRLFLDFARQAGLLDHDEVRDPFPDGDFDAAFRSIYTGCVALLNHLQAQPR